MQGKARPELDLEVCETLALLESTGINKLKLERMDFDPYAAFATIE